MRFSRKLIRNIVLLSAAISIFASCSAEDDYVASWRFKGSLFEDFIWMYRTDGDEAILLEGGEVLRELNGTDETYMELNALVSRDLSQELIIETDASSDIWFDMISEFEAVIDNGTGSYEECTSFNAYDDNGQTVYSTIDSGYLDLPLYCLSFETKADGMPAVSSAGILYIEWNDEWQRVITLIPKDFKLIIDSMITFNYSGEITYTYTYSYKVQSNEIVLDITDSDDSIIRYKTFNYDDNGLLQGATDYDLNYSQKGEYTASFSGSDLNKWSYSESEGNTNSSGYYYIFNYHPTDGTITRVDVYDAQDNHLYYYLYNYNAEGLLDTKIKRDIGDNLLGTNEYRYNESGYLMTLFRFDQNEHLLDYTVFSYKYGYHLGDDQITVFLNPDLQ